MSKSRNNRENNGSKRGDSAEQATNASVLFPRQVVILDQYKCDEGGCHLDPWHISEEAIKSESGDQFAQGKQR